jgi:hypothetical protein
VIHILLCLLAPVHVIPSDSAVISLNRVDRAQLILPIHAQVKYCHDRSLPVVPVTGREGFLAHDISISTNLSTLDSFANQPFQNLIWRLVKRAKGMF